LDFSTALASRLTFAEVLEAGLPRAAAMLGADATWVMRLSREHAILIYLAGFSASKRWKFPVTGAVCPLEGCPNARAAIEGQEARVLRRETLSSEAESSYYGPDAQAWLLAPMISGGAAPGVLGFAFRQVENEPDPEARELARMLANQLAVAMERAQLYESERERREALESLQATSRALNSTSDAETIFHIIVTEAARVLHADAVSLMLWNDAHDALAIRASHGLSERYTREQQIAQDVVEGILQGGDKVSTLVIPNLLETPLGIRELIEAEGLAGVLATPLRDDSGKLLGTLNVYTKTSLHRFSPTEADLATAFASQASVAIQRARLYDELVVRLAQATQAIQRLRALQRVGSSVAGVSPSVTHTLEAVREAVDTILEGALVPVFMLIDPAGGRQLRVRFAAPESPPWRILTRAIGLAQDELVVQLDELTPAVRQALETGEPYPAQSLAELGVPWLDAARAERIHRVFGIKSLVLIPLASRGQLVGVMLLPTREPEIPQQTLSVLLSFAEQTALALEATRLLETTEEHVRELGILREAMSAAAASASVDELCTSVTTVLSQTLYPELFGFAVWDDDTEVFYVHPSYHGISPENRASRLRIGEGIIGRAAALQQPVVVPDVTKDPDYVNSGANARSEMAAPILVRGKVVAVMNVESREPNAFSQQEADFLAVLANHLATAIDRTRLYEALRRWAADLQEANVRLHRADQLKTQMIQTIAHELRTPLTYVANYVSLLLSGEMGPLNADQLGSLEIVDRKASALTRLVSDIVTLYVMDEAPLALQEVSVQALAAEAILAASHIAESAGISLQTRLPDDLPTVLADPFRMAQVFDNLLSNAIKFSPGGGAVRIEARVVEHMMQIEVADTGIGIPEDKLEQIFERFYQVDSSATRSFGGVGLGLAICREIVRAHGGWIWATSVLGKGSTFSFTLPLAAELESAPPQL